jgi:hypothetical protein
VPDRPGAGRFRLSVRIDNPAATIVVTDYAFEGIFKDVGKLDMRDKPGVSKVRVEIGRDIALLSEEVVLLNRDLEIVRTTKPQLASPAPIAGSSHTHEYQRDPFYATRTSVFPALAENRSAMSLLSRYWTAPDARLPHPMDGLHLLDAAGEVVADLQRDCQVDDRVSGDPVAVWDRELPPGSYYLRQVLPDGRRLDGSLVTSSGWITQVALQRLGAQLAVRSGSVRVGGIGDVAVFMRAPGDVPEPPDQDAVIEAARLAPLHGRNLFEDGHGAELGELLLVRYRDPIAGIIGCHLLLWAMATDGSGFDPQRYDEAVRRLRALVGTDHPDVEALSLRYPYPASGSVGSLPDSRGALPLHETGPGWLLLPSPGRGGVLDRADRRADRSCVPPPRRGVAGVR